jgi:hypothetical protein
MKQEDLLREFLDLPPEGQAQVVDLIEFLRARYDARRPNGNATSSDLAAESLLACGKTAKTCKTAALGSAMRASGSG